MSTGHVVALIDDDENVRTSLERLLRSAGMTAEVYASAKEFLHRPRPGEPDCLLLDLQMPEMDGLELLEELKRAGRTIPVIFITGSESFELKARAFESGAVAYLVKPALEEVLLSTIIAAIEPDPMADTSDQASAG
jgi:FixJ family two-component response regulator